MEKSIRIDSVNVSKEKGTRKIPVEVIELTCAGIFGDAHCENGHRQVSMLDAGTIKGFARGKNLEHEFGDFAENLTVSGMAMDQVQVFDLFENEIVSLEVTQLGKKCTAPAGLIDNSSGDCLMARAGIFLRVNRPGILKPGDRLNFVRKVFRILVVTVSDRASAGIYEDKSGPRIRQMCEDLFKKNSRSVTTAGVLVPDNPERIADEVKNGIKEAYDMIITTGGTGIGPRDLTPEAIRPLLDKEIPGIMEMVRIKYGMEKPNALLSRSVAGTAGKKLIYVLPGSEKAVMEYMVEILRTVNHSMLMLQGIGDH